MTDRPFFPVPVPTFATGRRPVNATPYKFIDQQQRWAWSGYYYRGVIYIERSFTSIDTLPLPELLE